MNLVAAPPEMRQLTQSLVISPNLDALLEHEDRVRRIRHGPSASLASPTFGGGLPPPPRRHPNAPTSPSPLSPTYSLEQERDTETESIESLEGSNPYINPAPQFAEEPPRTPISPPPRSSSMNISFEGRLEPVRVRRETPTSPVATTLDRSPSSSTSGGTSSPADSRRSPSLTLPSLALRKKSLSTSKEESQRPASIGHRRSRSRGKLVKPPPEPASPSLPPSKDVMAIRRQRSSRSISVSSAISADRESFIDFDLSSPAADDFALQSPSVAPQLKPPIPTTPKPDFSGRRRHPSPNTAATGRRKSPHTPPPSLPLRALPPDTMPPTTNFLNSTERAQLIRKSRKLTQVFGQTPGAGDLASDPSGGSFLDITPVGTSKSRHRPAASMNMVGQMPPSARPRLPLPWPAPDKTIYMDVHGRRHSSPNDQEGPQDDVSSEAPSSPMSFMDLSASSSNSNSHDDDGADTERETELGPDDSVSVMSLTFDAPLRRKKQTSPSTISFAESISPETQADDDRRKRRDKLAKLHRFLGSRVPTNLVLGQAVVVVVPAVVGLDGTLSPSSESGGDTRKGWANRRRSSSAAVLASSWTSDWERMKENLNDKEKAIIVRRAQKMEKVFGVAPPQDLYSGRSTPPGTLHTSGVRTVPVSPTVTPPASPPGPSTQRNLNQSSYRRSKASRRPRTGDSGEFLLADVEPSAGSFVYTHYQQSLSSLHDIIDRNDHESLAELHQYLNEEGDTEAPPPSPPSAGGTSKSERRRSLPVLLPRASISSLSSIASDVTATSPDAMATEFQTRRRRAAKLTQFFGVDYRELIDDVLESIEAGLDAERSRGTLNPAEADVLLHKLRTLRTRR
ncbi:hypothetical protein C8F01DRAFT_385113 [Mycena amicta]|nr:hypothetical protein C8F01DRAFT_385113 [Mycena amicta]